MWLPEDEDVKQLEGHLTWIDDIIWTLLRKDEKVLLEFSRKLVENGGDFVKTKAYLMKLIVDKYSKKSQESGEDGRPDQYFEANFQNPNYARLLALDFGKLVKSVLIRDLSEEEEGARRELVENIRDMLKNLEGEHERLVEVMEYFLEALDWSMDKLKRNDPEEEEEKASDDKLKLLKYKWERFHGDDKSKAAILYLKSCVQRELGALDEEGQLKVLRKVIELDPEYHIWHLYAYQLLRHRRRVFKDNNLTGPCQEEMDSCQKAYDLCPNIMLSKFHLAMMLKDCLWMNVLRKWFKTLEIESCHLDIPETLQNCLKLYDDACQLAEEHGTDEWILKISYRKAELLLYVSEDEKGCDEGFNLLLKLIEECPTNAFLHQKLARVSQYGILIGKKRLYLDLSKAMEHLKINLALRQFNYDACLKEYIKLFKYVHQPLNLLKEVLQILSESLIIAEEIGMGYLVPKIRIWRGCVLWIYNPEENQDSKEMAIEDWLFVLEKFVDQRKVVFDMVWKPPFGVKPPSVGVHIPGKICTNKLKDELEKIRNEPETSRERLEVVEMFLKEIDENSNPDEFSSADKVPGGLHRRVYLETGSDDKEETAKHKRGSVSCQSQKPKRKGLANQDNDWRRK